MFHLSRLSCGVIPERGGKIKYNALTGLAVAFEGFVLQNPAMIIAGAVFGSAGTLLTQLMAKAMNRSLDSVLFNGFGEAAVEGGGGGIRQHAADTGE